MGRLIIGLVVIVVLAIIFGSWLSWMNNHNKRVSLGLGGSKKRIAELEAERKINRTALRQIRALAETNRAIFSDPIWDLIITKTDEALELEEK